MFEKFNLLIKKIKNVRMKKAVNQILVVLSLLFTVMACTEVRSDDSNTDTSYSVNVNVSSDPDNLLEIKRVNGDTTTNWSNCSLPSGTNLVLRVSSKFYNLSDVTMSCPSVTVTKGSVGEASVDFTINSTPSSNIIITVGGLNPKFAIDMSVSTENYDITSSNNSLYFHKPSNYPNYFWVGSSTAQSSTPITIKGKNGYGFSKNFSITNCPSTPTIDSSWDVTLNGGAISSTASKTLTVSKAGKLIKVCSDSDVSQTWPNATFREKYELTTNGFNFRTSRNGTSISDAAWEIQAVKDDNVTLTIKPKVVGYCFVKNDTTVNDSVSNITFSDAISNTEYNQISFTASGLDTVGISGMAYTAYTTNFVYNDSEARMEDVINEICVKRYDGSQAVGETTAFSKLNEKCVCSVRWNVSSISENTQFRIHGTNTGYLSNNADISVTLSLDDNDSVFSSDEANDIKGSSYYKPILTSDFEQKILISPITCTRTWNCYAGDDVCKYVAPENGDEWDEDGLNTGSVEGCYLGRKWKYTSYVVKDDPSMVEFYSYENILNNIDISGSSEDIGKDGTDTNAADGKAVAEVREDKRELTITLPWAANSITLNDEILNFKETDVDIKINDTTNLSIGGEALYENIKLYNGNSNLELNKQKNILTIEDKGRKYNKLNYNLRYKNDTIKPENMTLDLYGGEEKICSVKIKETVGDAEGFVKVYKSNCSDNGWNDVIISIDPDIGYYGNISLEVSGLEVVTREITFLVAPHLKLLVGAKQEVLVDNVSDSSWIEGHVDVYNGSNNEFYLFCSDFNRLYNDPKLITSDNAVLKVVEPDDDNFEGCGVGKSKEYNKMFIKIKNTDKDYNFFCAVSEVEKPPTTFTDTEGLEYYKVKKDGSSWVIDNDIRISGQQSTKAEDGEKYRFAVKVRDGYDISTLKLYKNGVMFGDEDCDKTHAEDGYYIYSFEPQVWSIKITASLFVRRCIVNFNKVSSIPESNTTVSGIKYIYNGAELSSNSVKVNYGDSVSFEVVLPEEYNQSNLVVNNTAGVQSKIGNRYVISDIKDDMDISVNNLSLNKYVLVFKKNDKAYFQDENGDSIPEQKSVLHGERYRFKVVANEGYKLGDNIAVNLKYDNGRQEAPVGPDANGFYTIRSVSQPISIIVSGVEELTYDIVLKPVLGVTYLNSNGNVITDSVKIGYGRNFEFSVELEDSYDDSISSMHVILNDGKSTNLSAQKVASGKYIIKNIVEDVTINIGNVRKNTYVVTLKNTEGIDYHDMSGKVITGDNNVSYRESLDFKVDIYPAYSKSKITVMLGDSVLEPNSNGSYTVPKVVENKTVTVLGLEENEENKIINDINSLTDKIDNLDDVSNVTQITKLFDMLSEEQKGMVQNIGKLSDLQDQTKMLNHVSNDVRIDGVDWYVKLYAVPIIDDIDACERVYNKLNSEYILSLYNIYLWDTLNDCRYTLPEGTNAVITLPTPDLTYFENPSAVHVRDNGKLDFIKLSFTSTGSVFETDSFSPMGIIANRTSTPGVSSLLSAADANIDAIKNFAASAFGQDSSDSGSSAKKVKSDLYLNGSSDSDKKVTSDSDASSGNINEKFKSSNNVLTASSSALRLTLVLMLLAILWIIIYMIFRRKKEKSKK